MKYWCSKCSPLLSLLPHWKYLITWKNQSSWLQSTDYSSLLAELNISSFIPRHLPVFSIWLLLSCSYCQWCCQINRRRHKGPRKHLQGLCISVQGLEARTVARQCQYSAKFKGIGPALPLMLFFLTYTWPHWVLLLHICILEVTTQTRSVNDSTSQTYFSLFPIQHSKSQLSHRNKVNLKWSSTIIDISITMGTTWWWASGHEGGALAFPFFFYYKALQLQFSEAIQLLLWYFQSDIPFSIF